MKIQISAREAVVRVVDGRCFATPRQSQCGIFIRWLLLLLGLVVADNLVVGSSIAASYDIFDHNTWMSGRMTEPYDQSSLVHSEVVAAGFGVQAEGSSMIMVRTYDASTGGILSDDSFDLSVKEEGEAEAGKEKGRIFAGGIGVDKNGKSTFMLSAYDAETGKFLWEGQLHLLKVGDQGVSKVKASISRNRTLAVLVGDGTPKAFDTLFALRAVNPLTGGLVWQDQFAPGRRGQRPADGASIGDSSKGPGSTPIAHVFDLTVRTYDHGSGRLLWEDSFEQVDQDEEVLKVPETNQRPQAIPFRHIPDGSAPLVHRAAFR